MVMMKTFALRRVVLSAFACMLLVTAANRASAQDTYPARTVTLVVPAAAGSTTDTLARLLADQLSQTWGKAVVVENVARGMNVGAEHVARATPDGYTLLVSPPGPLTIFDLLYRDINYSPKQFAAISLLAKIPNALVTRPDLPAKTVQDLVAYGRTNPGKLSYGSQGAGSTAHLSASQLELLAGIKMVHVPYRGAQPALNDLVAGHIDIFFDTLTTSVPLHEAGKVKIMAVAGAERSPALPDIPTIAEAGFPGFRSITWFGLVGPPNTPPALVSKVNRDVVAILQRADVSAKLRGLRLDPMIGTPDDALRFFADETQLWGKVIREANITIQ
jgi:tripartite-type tricarboxylate transporter receptor subunit TctC